MEDTTNKIDPMFLHLVISLQAGAMQQMGKVASPLSGKVERNLEGARFSIDMLGMLQEKMKGNLTAEESKFLDHVLYELRLNFVDEQKKPDSPSQAQGEEMAEENTGDKAEEKAESADNSDQGEADRPKTD